MTKEIHKLALERFKLCEDAWDDNHKLAKEDMEFRAGKHWTDKDAKKRDGEGRPCLVVDKLNQYVRQVVNDGRQNRPSVKVRPIDDNGDEEIAEALQGLIRHILDRSNADDAFDTALESAVVGGFGYFRVTTDYAHENTFNQEILVERIRNPLAVYLDPNARKADGSDSRFGFVVDELTKEQFRQKYPKAKFTDFEAEAGKYSDGWESGDNVRVCEYFWKEDVPSNVHLLETGETIDDVGYQAALSQGVPVPAIVETRELTRCQVKWARISGAEVLEENDWLGKYIPIIPVYGNEFDLDGKVTYSGLIRFAKDPQRLYNYSRSAYAERVALAPKAPFIAAAGQVDAYSEEWESANTESHSVLKYDPVEGAPPPQRQQASDIPEGFARDMQLSEHDIQASMGMYNASLGEKSNEKSGKAILARQREGDVATFHYMDNLNRAVRHLGRILVDLAPKVYDSRRTIRILGEDGEQVSATVNPEQQDAVVKEGSNTIYNLNIGEYDVSVSAGPSYTTKRQEQAEAMMQMTQANPAVMQIAGDILVKSMDWPGADDLAERFKLMLPPQIAQALQAKEQDSMPPEAQMIMAQAQQAMAEKDQQLQQAVQGLQERDQAMQDMQAQLRELQIQLKDKGGEIQIREIETQIKAYDAETKRLQAMTAANTPAESTPQAPTAQVVVDGKDELMGVAGTLQQTVQQQSDQLAQALTMIAQSQQGFSQAQDRISQALALIAQGQDSMARAYSAPRRMVIGPDGSKQSVVVN